MLILLFLYWVIAPDRAIMMKTSAARAVAILVLVGRVEHSDSSNTLWIGGILLHSAGNPQR